MDQTLLSNDTNAVKTGRTRRKRPPLPNKRRMAIRHARRAIWKDEGLTPAFKRIADVVLDLFQYGTASRETGIAVVSDESLAEMTSKKFGAAPNVKTLSRARKNLGEFFEITHGVFRGTASEWRLSTKETKATAAESANDDDDDDEEDDDVMGRIEPPGAVIYRIHIFAGIDDGGAVEIVPGLRNADLHAASLDHLKFFRDALGAERKKNLAPGEVDVYTGNHKKPPPQPDVILRLWRETAPDYIDLMS